MTCTNNNLESVWLNALMRHDPKWLSSRATTTEQVFHNQKFVVFDLVRSRPVIFDVLRVRGLDISWGHGLVITLASGRGLPSLYITTHPRADIAGVYLWLPSHAQVKHAPVIPSEPLSLRRATVEMCIRTQTKTEAEGARYMLTLEDFQAIWPDLIKGF